MNAIMTLETIVCYPKNNFQVNFFDSFVMLLFTLLGANNRL